MCQAWMLKNELLTGWLLPLGAMVLGFGLTIVILPQYWDCICSFENMGVASLHWQQSLYFQADFMLPSLQSYDTELSPYLATRCYSDSYALLQHSDMVCLHRGV
jgi:hypothetical protein